MRLVKPAHVVIAVVAIGVVVFLARNTEWGEISLPAPLRGEAARDPFYAARRLVEALGATSGREQTLGATSTSALAVLSHWAWDIEATRRRELEQWVEGGGRLVVDATLISGSDAFERWSGIERVPFTPVETEEADDMEVVETAPRCEDLREIRYRPGGTENRLGYYEVCDFDDTSYLVATRPLEWGMRARDMLQAARTRIGAGTVTVVNGAPFHYRALFDGDHAELLVAALGLVPGDHVVFLSEEDYPSLAALVWRYGSPVVVACLIGIALALWRGAARFGPLVGPSERARRSLGAQILGTGRFIARVGSAAALHAAAARALDEAAGRRISGYERLARTEQMASIARAAAVDPATLAAAMNAAGQRDSLEARAKIAVLESARRQLISGSRWSNHGKRI